MTQKITQKMSDALPNAAVANERRLEFAIKLLTNTICEAIGKGHHRIVLERPLFDIERVLLENKGYTISTYTGKYFTHTFISWDDSETLSEKFNINEGESE